MEIKEQTNQNPDGIQEEKPKLAEKAAEKIVSKSSGPKATAQIKPKEKQDIQHLHSLTRGKIHPPCLYKAYKH